MTANVDAMVRAGVDAYREGNKAEARTLLERAIELDDHNETAWLWLSAVVDTQEEQQTCLENVLVINPTNERARQGLRSLGIDPDSITGATPQEAAPAFTDDAWNVPTSSASSEGSAPELSSDQYDDWMSNLNIGSAAQSAPPAESAAQPQAQQQEDIFGTDDFALDDDSFSFGDDLFDDDTFDGGGDFAYDDDNYYDGADGYDDGGYDAGNNADGGYDPSYDSGYDPTTEYADDYNSGYTDDYGSDGGIYSDSDFEYSEDSISSFDSAVDDGILGDLDAGEFAGDAYADAYEDDDAEPTPAELFVQIPPEIKPTRVPGKNEEPPAMAGIITAVLGVVNVVAIGFVLLRFFV